MRVVILHPPLYPVNHAFFNLLGQKVDLTVYSFGKKPGLHKWQIESKGQNYNLKIIDGYTDLKKYAVSYKAQLKLDWIKDILKDRPDIVISVAFWMPSLYASIMKKFLGYKFLIITDAIFETEKNISISRKIIRKIICYNVDAMISASNLTTRYLHSLCNYTTVYQSLQTIDINNWNKKLNNLPEKYFLRNELNLPKEKHILLGVGGFTKKKNWQAVFRQMNHLEKYHFVLIGSGEEEKNYKVYINDNNLEDKITILPRKEGVELIKYFKVSDIFLFPSLCDQFGYVVLEALVSSLPVICSQNSGASSLIINNQNGFIIDPNKDFFKEITLTINNLKQMQMSASQSMKNMSLENKTLEFEKIFKSILELK